MSVAEAPVEEAQPKPKRVRKPRVAKVEAPVVESPVVKPARKPRVRKPKVAPVVDLVPTVDPGDPLALLAQLPATVVGDLSVDQRHSRYDYLKRVVSVSLGSFVLIGRALDEIRENEYFKLDRYDSWDEFVQTEWDLGSKQRASQLILAARTFVALKDHLVEKGIEIPLPQIESHVLQLQKLDSVEEQANAWQAAYATAERKAGDRLRLTADHIGKTVQEYLGFKKLADTGPGTNNPTPPETPPAREPVPPTVEPAPEDSIPPEDAAPEDGDEPDPLDGFVPTVGETEIITEGGKPKTLTPTVALQYLIKALKGGYLSHRDPLVKSLAEVVQESLITWNESSDDTVEIDYDEGDVPEITVEYRRDDSSPEYDASERAGSPEATDEVNPRLADEDEDEDEEQITEDDEDSEDEEKEDDDHLGPDDEIDGPAVE